MEKVWRENLYPAIGKDHASSGFEKNGFFF